MGLRALPWLTVSPFVALLVGDRHLGMIPQ
jgi:hypothetical protein